jgi:hypothetical protein
MSKFTVQLVDGSQLKNVEVDRTQPPEAFMGAAQHTGWVKAKADDGKEIVITFHAIAWVIPA